MGEGGEGRVEGGFTAWNFGPSPPLPSTPSPLSPSATKKRPPDFTFSGGPIAVESRTCQTIF